jgi:acylphosphatase
MFAGWCMNTTYGSVKGRLEGDEGRIRQMMEWLKTTGSPKSNITRATFTEPKPIKEYSVRNFTIKR